MAEYLAKGRDSEIDHIPATEFCAPKSIDFTHGHHICIDGLYYAYLLVPSDGYKTQVPAGWLSLIVNAGDGIDMDMFLSRQPKETIIQKVGQQLRINRSKIKDASDTNTDFDDIDGAIRSGYFLKEGLANNEDFYYLNLLITITASNEEDLEWKVSEMKKLLLSQDMNACTCHFREEQAFLSALPLVAMEKKLYERGKRNLLTGGAASCYPFTSYEMCDDNGILLGVNKYNSSLIIVDIFNSAVYIVTPKTSAGVRIVPMLSEVKAALQAEWETQKIVGFNESVVDGYTGFIFQNRYGDPLSPHSVNRAIDRICAAYIEDETVLADQEGRNPVLIRHFSAHNLRHTFCTRFCENERNIKVIQEIMGHADIETTMNIYAEATKEKKKESFSNLEGKIKIS